MLTVTTTDQAPELPPPTVSTPDPRLLSFEADLLLSRGDTRYAAWLSRKAEAMREGGDAVLREVNGAAETRGECCQRHVRRGSRYFSGCVLPAVARPTMGLAFLICDACGLAPEGLDSAVAWTVRREWPDATWTLDPAQGGAE